MEDVKINAIWAYTDYPFVEFADISYQVAPMRRVLVIGYDGNNYCNVLVSGNIVEESRNNPGYLVLSVKRGHLYKSSERGNFNHDNYLSVDELSGIPNIEHVILERDYLSDSDLDVLVRAAESNVVGRLKITPRRIPERKK